MKGNEKKEVKTRQTMDERQGRQKGSPSMSKKDTSRQEKDESKGSEKNTTKKQQNSV